MKEVIVDHYECSWLLQSPSPSNWFKKLVRKVDVSKVMLDCLDTKEENITDFITTLASINNYEIVIFGFGKYTFTVKDLELMVEKDLKITYFETRAITNKSEISKLLEFLNVLKRMKHLKELFISFDDLEDQDYKVMESMVGLPIKYISSLNFQLEGGNVERIIEILS